MAYRLPFILPFLFTFKLQFVINHYTAHICAIGSDHRNESLNDECEIENETFKPLSPRDLLNHLNHLNHLNKRNIVTY